MRFFRYTTAASHPIYASFSPDERRVLRHFDEAIIAWTTAANEIIPAASIQGKWLIIRIDRFDPAGFLLLESVGELLIDGETPAPQIAPENFYRFTITRPGFYAVKMPAARNLTMQSTGAHLSGMAALSEIGELTDFPATTGAIRNKPAVYTSLTQKSYVSDYERALQLRINLTGAAKADADLLASLADLPRFWCWSSGGGIDGDASWAAREVFVPMVVGDWAGWNGGSDTAIHGAHGQMELLETGRYFTPEDYDGLAGDVQLGFIAFGEGGGVSVGGRFATIAAGAINREVVFDEFFLHAGDNVQIQSSQPARSIKINTFDATDLFVHTIIAGTNFYNLPPVGSDGNMELRVSVQ